jgi:UDP-N-acetylglucosamine 2-epimerase (non-hydrolysing)
MQISAIVGARPNFMKMAAIADEVRQRPAIGLRLIHTGQHYSPEMSDTFFTQLGMPEPDVNLGAGGGSHTAQTAAVMLKLEPDLIEHRPDVVLVVGDVNSTLAGALVAAKLGIPVAHVEAGLRSFDRRMPEEINRIVTDALSDFLFVSEPSGVRNLIAEGVAERKIFFTGNVMIDTLLKFRSRAAQTDVVERLGLRSGDYAVATLHRPSNVDAPTQLEALVKMLKEVAKRIPVIFPIHPRTREQLQKMNLATDGVVLTPPLGYLEFLRLTSEARVVLTDSGGIQEETTILQVRCLTLRENTERPVTIEQGTNRLVGIESNGILQAVLETLDAPPVSGKVPNLWDGCASSRILDILQREIGVDRVSRTAD